MSIAKKCDRCGVLYTPYHMNADKKVTDVNGFAFVNISDFGEGVTRKRTYDLCNPCTTSLVTWLNDGAENPPK